MKKVLTVVCMLALCVFSVFAMKIDANAAVTVIETIEPGDVWHQSWSSEMQSQTVNLKVNETGWYNATIIDYNQTGYYWIDIRDLTALTYVDYIDRVEPTGTYVSQNLYFVKDHEYSLTCYYYIYDEGDEDTGMAYPTYLDADISIVFEKNNNALPVLPTGSLTSSNLMVQFPQGWSTEIFQYTTSQAGDYSLNFSNLHAYVTVYNATTGEELSRRDTESWSYGLSQYVPRTRLVYTLDANTTYYFEIESYNECSTLLSVSKNEKDVKTIEAYQLLYEYPCYWDAPDAVDFSHKITYTDGSSEIADSLELLTLDGYEGPIVAYVGATVNIDDEIYLGAGEQPVESTYMGETTTIYIKITSFVEWLSDKNAISENDICTITYESEEEQSYWWRIRFDESGYYGVWRYNSDDFGTNFNYFSLRVLDENNNLVEYDNTQNGFKLLAGKDYAFNFTYQYDPDYSYNDIEFWFQKGADLPDGWLQQGKDHYYCQNGDICTGWQKLNNSWYYFNSTGVMQTGWQLISGKWYYFANSGAMQTGWLNLNNKWYYMNNSGAMVTGITIADGKLCNFNASGIWLGYLTGWNQQNSSWYYAESNCAAATGWQKISGKWYFFDNTGVMQTGLLHISNAHYYFDANGAMQTGWQQVENAWYYFNASGAMATGWQQIGNAWYYFGTGGVMTTGWQKVGSTWYYFGTSGAMATGWQKVGNTWYYFNASGAMATGWQKVGTTWYYFQSGGAMQTGWLKQGNTWYYFGSSGAMATGSVTIGTKTYNFNSSGACLNP